MSSAGTWWYKATYAVTDMFDWLYDYSDLKDYIKLVRFADVSPHGGLHVRGAEACGLFKAHQRQVHGPFHGSLAGWAPLWVESMLARCKELGVTILTEHAAEALAG